MSSLPSLTDALIVFILLVPGFIAFNITRKLGVANRRLSEFETTVWSFMFTAVILFVFTLITGLTSIDLIRDQFFYPVNFSILFGLTIGAGLLIGTVLRKFKQHYQPGDPWTIAMKHFAPDGAWIKVMTKTGQEYTGKYRYAGIEDDAKEVMITEPTQIIRNPNGSILSKMTFGKEILFTEEDIARVVFFKDWEQDENNDSSQVSSS